MAPLAPRQYKPSQASHDRQTYIPPSMQDAMAQQMQQSLPAHLKKYATGSAGYVPERVERQIMDHMKKTAPGHMKEYVGAFVQQTIVTPNASTPAGGPPHEVMPHAPIPDLKRRDHSLGFGQQYSIDPNSRHSSGFDALTQNRPLEATVPGSTYPAMATPQQQGPQSQTYDPGGQAKPPGQEAYGFIFDPPKPAKKPLFSGGGSLLQKVALIGIALVVLVIILSFVKGLLAGSSNLPEFISVAQDQQALIHTASNLKNLQQVNISSTTSNVAGTAQLALASAQANTLTYLKANGKKVNTKVLNQRINVRSDSQLAAAANAGTYDATFKQVMADQLGNYERDIQQTYAHTKGTHGRQLLHNLYGGAQLLVIQLDAPSN